MQSTFESEMIAGLLSLQKICALLYAGLDLSIIGILFKEQKLTCGDSWRMIGSNIKDWRSTHNRKRIETNERNRKPSFYMERLAV